MQTLLAGTILALVTHGTPHQVLALGAGQPALDGVVSLLDPKRFAVQCSRRPDEGLQLVAAAHWDLILAAYPTSGFGVDELAAVIRTPSSPSRRSGLVAVAEPDDVAEASLHIGLGLNRVISLNRPVEEIQRTLEELLEAAPRVLVRAVVELSAHVGDRRLRSLYQTENVSSSGMLIRGGRVFPLGSSFEFDLSVPAQPIALHGSAEVVRHTDPFRERIEGFAARFVGFNGDGHDRLANWLDARMT